MADDLTIWSDTHHEIKHDAKGDIKRVFNVDAVATSVYNIIGTNKGERVMLPQFGANLGSIVFDNITPDLPKEVASRIKEEIEAWDDRVEVVNIRYHADPDTNYIEMIIKFRIKGYEREFEASYRIGG